MEFPKSAFCNVHKIDGISSIQWSTYSVQRGTHIADRYGSPLEEKPFDAEHALNNLLASETQLRDNGYHVYLDRCEAVLWMFDLSETVIKRESNSEEGIEAAELLEAHGCKRQSFGTVRASDLVDGLELSKSSSSDQKTAFKIAELFNSGASQMNRCLNALETDIVTQSRDGREANCEALGNNPGDNAMIYEKIIIAISMSVLYILAKEYQCIPSSFDAFFLSTDSCLEVSYDARHSLQGCTCRTAISLFVQWHSTGTLVISSYPVQTLRWSSITSAFDEILDVPTTLDNIVLAPLGISVRLSMAKSQASQLSSENDFDGDSDSQKSSETPYFYHSQDWRMCVTKFLESYGVIVPHQTRWLQVQAPHASNESSRHSASVFLWPAFLCFYYIDSSETIKEDLSWAWDSDNQDVMDTLAQAEHWFLTKSTRDMLIETSKKQTETEGYSKSNAVRSDDEDSGSEIYVSTQTMIDEQALSGIYPTPPDGYQSSTVSGLLAPEKDALSRGHTKELFSSGSEAQQNQEHLEIQLPHTSPENDIGLGDFEHLEEDDLFGDMNTDMFAASGITEADFSFFDEPSNAKEVSQGEYYMLSSEQNFSTQFPQNPGESCRGNEDVDDIDILSQVSNAKEDPDVKMNDYLEELYDVEGIVEDSHTSGVLSPPESPGVTSKQKVPAKHLIQSNQPMPGSSPIADQVTGLKWLQPQGRLIQYGRLAFEDQSTAFDEKYVPQGRFGVDTKSELTGTEPPETTLKESKLPRLQLLARHEAQSNLDEYNDTENDSDELSLPEIRGMPILEAPENQHIVKRKRETSEVGDSDLLSSKSFVQYASDGNIVNETHLLNQLIAQSSSLSFTCLTDMLQHTTKSNVHLYSDDAQSFIQLAQVVSEQIAAEAQLLSEYSSFIKDELTQSSYQASSRYNDALQYTIPKTFPSSERCDFVSYASFAYATGSNSSSNIAPHHPLRKQDKFKESQGQGKIRRLIFEIPCPNVLTRRGDTLIEISAIALSYWEELGLGPCAGPKDVNALCIFPESQMLWRGAKNFLQSVSGTYQSLRLGSHVCYSQIGSFVDGLVPVQLVGPTVEEHIKRIDQLCERLGTMLARDIRLDRPIIIYMVYPFADPSLLPLFCNSYIKLLAAYASNAGGHTYSHVYDLVLKIIPTTMVASKTTIPIPPPQLFDQIAREIYERCSVQYSEELDSPARFNSSFQLARTVPKSVNFGLTSDLPKTLIGDDSSYHVAYSWCSDEHWLSVLLIDTQGTLCWKASYCLGICPSDLAFQKVARDIWSRILNIVNTRISSPRLVLAKDQAMSSTELQTWIAMASAVDSIQINLIIATVDLTPPLIFTGLPVTTSQSATDGGNVMTPVSTPITSSYDVGSPAVSSGWASPPRTVECSEIDPSARLVDKLDETWGMITGYSARRDITNEALAEGFLLKRAGERDDDGMVIMKVRVLHAEKVSEGVLSDVLIMYRALATLGRAKGVGHDCRGIMPWHLAVASKMRKGLNRLMPWGK